MNSGNIPTDKKSAVLVINAASNELKELLDECYTNSYKTVDQVRAAIITRIGA